MARRLFRFRLVVHRGLPNGLMLMPGGVKLVVGGMLQREQGIIGPGRASRISSSLRWLARWCRTWLCWLDEDHRQGDGGDDDHGRGRDA